MKPSHAIFVLAVAMAMALVVSVIVKPRLEADGSAPIIASATPQTHEDDEAETEMRRSTRLALEPDGHYWARALVNQKASVQFMVDTGASVVALTFEDAQKMGLNPASLDYKWEINTAGGTIMGASVTIDSIRINQVHVRDVEAMVLRSDLQQSLLGMSFLSKLHSYEFRGDRMIIRQ